MVGNRPIKVVIKNFSLLIFKEDKNKFCIESGINKRSLIITKIKKGLVKYFEFK